MENSNGLVNKSKKIDKMTELDNILNDSITQSNTAVINLLGEYSNGNNLYGNYVLQNLQLFK